MAHRIIKSLGEVDFYKLTMLQFIWYHHYDRKGRFRFHNRTDVRLGEYIDLDELRAELEHVTTINFPIPLVRKLRDSRVGRLFRPEFLEWLPTLQLSMPEVDVVDGRLVIEAEGTWKEITLWETLTLNIVNELYFRAKMRELGLGLEDVLAEGRRRLMAKIEMLKTRPEIRFADFGTRRRFSRDWHEEVLHTLTREIPDQLVGTSSVALALELGLTPIGTMAHEMDMGLQGIWHDLDNAYGAMISHEIFLTQWEELYGGDVGVALTDTYGSDYFFAHFAKFAKRWAALRHDSGDPFAFGERAIAWYQGLDIEPRDKTVVFSDGLSLRLILELFDRFVGRVGLAFGWGTKLTNDMGFDAWPDGNRGLRPLSIVMKLVELVGHALVKLSDNPAKVTGTSEAIERVLGLTGYDRKAAVRVECEV